MRIVNRTPYPVATVRRIILAAMPARGRPPIVVVALRTTRRDLRQGFTPTDPLAAVWLWVGCPSAYPDATARSWEHELAQNAAHESFHVEHHLEPRMGGERGADQRTIQARRKFR